MVLFKQYRALFRAFLNSNLTVLWLLMCNIFVVTLIYTHSLAENDKNLRLLKELDQNIRIVDKNVKQLCSDLISSRRMTPQLAIKSAYLGQDWDKIEQKGPIYSLWLDIYQEISLFYTHYYWFAIISTFILAFIIVYILFREKETPKVPFKKKKIQVSRKFINKNYQRIVKKREADLKKLSPNLSKYYD